MIEMTANLESFFEMMHKSVEHTRRGFVLLLEKPDFEEYLDVLQQQGFFKPESVPLPVPGDKPGTVRIDGWPAIIYLQAVAKRAAERNRRDLIDKVLGAIRAVTSYRDGQGKPLDNHTVYWTFAEILSSVPADAITIADIDQIEVWIKTRADGAVTSTTLIKGLIPRLLASKSDEDLAKAVRLLHHFTAFRWKKPKDEDGVPQAATYVEDYWLHKLLQTHGRELGARLKRSAASIFEGRIRELVGGDDSLKRVYAWRPAIEDHEQNHNWREPENRFVEGLRDVMLGWVDAEAKSAVPYVQLLLNDPLAILNRVAIYLINVRFTQLRDLVPSVLQPKYFGLFHTHEVYEFLSARFAEFNDKEKQAALEAMRNCVVSERDDQPGRTRRRRAKVFLSVVHGKGYKPADDYYAELNADESLGEIGPHPDMPVYIETGWGLGTSPFEVPQILEFLRDGSLAKRLIDFKEIDPWQGPTANGLADAVKSAVIADLECFMTRLDELRAVPLAYQYAIVEGFRAKWEQPADSTSSIDWQKSWAILLDYITDLICNDDFWSQAHVRLSDDTASMDWIPSTVADVLRSGTKKDEHAFDPALLPKSFEIIKWLLKKTKSTQRTGDHDPMSEAINTSKGRVLEALVDYSLRVCRVADKAKKQHTEEWAALEPVYDSEMQQSKNANYEFSTLMGCYVAHMLYMDEKWLKANIENIFPKAFETSFCCAMEGLSYSPMHKTIYQLLVAHGTIEHALKLPVQGKHARESLLNRIGVAYLWGDEQLSSPRLSYLFESGAVSDLNEIAWFYWSVRRQELKTEQAERVQAFFRVSVDWLLDKKLDAAGLWADLAKLILYFDDIDDSDCARFKEAARYLGEEFDVDAFVEELTRLLPVAQKNAATLYEAAILGNTPKYDHEGALLAFAKMLVDTPERSVAIKCSNHLRHIPEFLELYKQLTAH